MDLRKTISSSNNWLDLKAKIDSCANTKAKGDIFELLTKLYLQIDPRYVSKLKTVWLYNEVPTNTLKKLNLPTKDMGIDLVAETNEGEYWAIQCKYKADESKSLTWREISTFQSLAFSKAKGITFGLVATTVDRSASVFKDQKEDVKLLAGEVWRDLDDAFFKQARKILGRKIASPIPFKPRKHQVRAVRNAKKHFIKEKGTRGKMIMPCGTGKSLTAYWIAKELEAKTILIAVPSLSLINQTLQAWLREVVANKQTVDWIAVCSDKTAGEVDSAISTQDLGIPTNTDPEMIARWLRKPSTGLKVVFTTYQSGKVIAEASRSAKRVFDLGIMDEAHKTVGDRDKTFAHLLSDENIKIRKRVFMTATERRYTGSRDEIISMDNPEVYGDTFELLTFKEALEQDPPILSDYKILTMLVHKEDVANYIRERAIVKPDRGKWDDGVQAEMLAGVVALNQAMEKYPIKHAVSFHTSIAKAQAFKANQQTYTEAVEKDADQVETFFVSGKTPTSIRSRVVKEFASSDKALISNARCLTEGVDVPNIDGVLFADPKRSAVDIVQAVGRALRLSDGKDFGYIIIPVLIEDESDFEKSGAFQTILTVLRALASNDERIVEYFRDKANKKKSSESRFTPELTESLLERVELDQFVESIELQVWDKLAKLSWMSFEEAKVTVRKLGINSDSDWRRARKEGLLPANLPGHPWVIYPEYTTLGDFLETGRIADQYRNYYTYNDAKKIIQRDFPNIRSIKQYNVAFRDRELPEKFPSGLYNSYPKFVSGDFFGTGIIADAKKKDQFLDFESARKEARALGKKYGIKKQADWINISKEGKRPSNIPSRPDQTYENEFTSWPDFLGYSALGVRNKAPFHKTREFILSLGITKMTHWKKYVKNNPLPSDIPKSIDDVYRGDGWINSSSFFRNEYLDFKQAKKLIQPLMINSEQNWEIMRSDHSIPPRVPKYPQIYYLEEWISWPDFLGYEPKKKKQK